jgi:hypothetical protein
MAQQEYRSALKQLNRLRERTARYSIFPDPSFQLAELQVKKAARVLDHLIDLRLKATNQDTPIAPPTAPAPPSPTYSEFSDIPPFLSRPVSPVGHSGNTDLEEAPDQQDRPHYSVVVGRRTGVYASWYVIFTCNSFN